MKKKIFALALAMAALTTPAYAYKEVIHRVITLKAWDRFAVDLKPRLGITRNDSVAGTPLRALMGQAAYDEDAGSRALNHFFDPVHDAALCVPFSLCIPLGSTAQYWATSNVTNDYNTYDARQFYEAALLAPNAGARDYYHRELFQALGQSIHLVQDMAQPEHTRNDQHLPGSEYLLGNGTEASLYEEWGLANLLGASPAVPYDGYPKVSLPRYDDYFKEAGGRGLADFANRSSLTQDTNYSDERIAGKCHYFTAPVESAAAGRVEPNVGEVVRDAFGGTHVVVVDERILTSFPQDQYTGTQLTDPFHTFISAVDLETRRLGAPDTYSLGEPSYLTRASMLIPRAVGYSAGYLEHFFRGKIGATWTQVSGNVYNLLIKNESSEAIGADAYLKALYAPGAAYSGFGTDIVMIRDGYISEFLPGFAGIPAGGSVTLGNISVPVLKPGDKVTAFQRRIMIKGTLGQEPYDVIGLIQPGRPTKLKIEVDWQTPDPTLALGFYIGDSQGRYDVTWSAPSNCGTWMRHDIPNTTISPLGSKPMVFTIDPLGPSETLRYDVALNSCYPAPAIPQNVTVKIYGDNNELLSTETVFLTSFINRQWP